MKYEKILTGVCAKIAQEAKIEPWIIRILFIIFFGSGSFFIYLILTLIGYTL